MDLGPLTHSLAVKDLQASKAFYEKLGFKVIGGDETQNWLIMTTGDNKVGLFQGMFDKNILTFNPGLKRTGDRAESFTDIREIQKWFKERGLELTTEADEDSTGPANFTMIDPDGNPILFDQFF